MATINITVQSLLNAAQYDPYTVDDTTTVGTFKSTIETATGCNVNWFSLVFDTTDNSIVLDPTKTLAFYSIPNESKLRTANKISRLSTLQARQAAKLELSHLEREDLGNTRPDYDIAELPTYYSGNVVVDNPNTYGLIEGRPWLYYFFYQTALPNSVGTGTIDPYRNSFNSDQGTWVLTDQQNAYFANIDPDGFNQVWQATWSTGSTLTTVDVDLVFDGASTKTLTAYIKDPENPGDYLVGTWVLPVTFMQYS